MWNSEKMDSYDLKRNGNLVLKTIDLHTAGEPLRVLYEGIEDVKAKSVLDFRRIMKQKYDDIRKAIMWEPRGHADMYGCILLEPFNDKSDFGVIFMHN
jgi:proline racemase